ncbi:MAG: tetratricopeptide repeat protein [Armatimonadia bacterium]
MFRRRMRIPAPPGAGLIKIADPRLARLGWLVFIGGVLVIGGALWPFGLGAQVGRMRREFVALNYVRAAQAKSEGNPVRCEEALADLARATALAPNHPLVSENAAQLYVNLRAYKEALPWLRRQQGQSLLTRVSLAQSLLMAGSRQEGANLLEQVTQEMNRARRANQMPSQLYALMLNNIGYVRAVADLDVPQGRSLVDAAVNMEPQQAAYVDSMGWVEYKLGNFSAAAFYLERAVRLHLPAESAEMYYHLGAAYARLGRKPTARLVLGRALALDPSYEEARDELKLLSQDLPQPALACL